MTLFAIKYVSYFQSAKLIEKYLSESQIDIFLRHECLKIQDSFTICHTGGGGEGVFQSVASEFSQFANLICLLVKA